MQSGWEPDHLTTKEEGPGTRVLVWGVSYSSCYPRAGFRVQWAWEGRRLALLVNPGGAAGETRQGSWERKGQQTGQQSCPGLEGRIHCS